jgi:membrane protein implicated in regulation of membrane protease activity
MLSWLAVYGAFESRLEYPRHYRGNRTSRIPFLKEQEGRRVRIDEVVMLPMLLMMTAPLWGLVLFLFLPLGIALPVYVAVAALAIWSHVLMRRAARRPAATGAEALLGRTRTVVSWHGMRGTVRCHSEVWAARSTALPPPAAGERVKVVGIEHLTLEVVKTPVANR